MVWFSSNDSHVGIAGDWHGDAHWAEVALEAFRAKRIHAILHVGDFEVRAGQSGAHYLRRVDLALAANSQTLYVTPGNHEDYGTLDRTQPGSDGLVRITPRIIFMPRGFRWEWGTRKFVSFGGAPSVDFDRQHRGRTWWPQEAITAEDVDRLRTSVANRGGADVMITHDAPKGLRAIDASISGNPFGFSARALRYAAEGRDRLDEAFEAVKPTLLLHGHYHLSSAEVLRRDGFSTRVISLDMERRRGNLVALSLRDLSVETVVPGTPRSPKPPRGPMRAASGDGYAEEFRAQTSSPGTLARLRSRPRMRPLVGL